MTNQMTDAQFCRDMRIQVPAEWLEPKSDQPDPEQYYTYGGIIYDAKSNGPAGRQRWPEWLRRSLGWIAAALVFGMLGFAVCWWGTRP